MQQNRKDTGLKDIHNKPILENDIVRWGMNGLELSGVRYAIVNLDILYGLSFELFKLEDQETHEFKHATHIFKYSNFIYTDTHNYLEVLGNIYDNKELLEVRN